MLNITKKIKILILILIVVAVSVAGWWFYYTQIENRCNSDNDCRFFCGCGCISKQNLICSIFSPRVLCEQYPCAVCRCLNGKCASWDDIFQEAQKTKNIELCYEIKNKECKNHCLSVLENLTNEVTITTNKTEYEKGEMVETTTFNGLNFSIYSDFWKGSWIVFQYQDTEWQEIFNGRYKTIPICLCDQYPDGNCPMWEAPMEKFDEIKFSESMGWSWDQKILKGTDKGCSIWINASPGKYKIEFKHFYTLDPNKREWEIVYSNEFTIK